MHLATRAVRAIVGLILCAGLVSGCLLPTLSNTGGADSGPGDRDTGSPGDTGTGDTREPDTVDPPPDDGGPGSPFSEAKTVLQKNCTGCHSTGAGSTTQLRFPSSEPSNSEYKNVLIPDFVTPGNPGSSPIYKRTQQPSETAMPESVGSWQTDEEESEKTLEEWIAGGAEIPTGG